MSSTPNLAQVHYRIRTDTAGVDATPTWAAAEDTGASLAIETTFRIRFVIQNTGTAFSTAPFALRVSKNAGAYTAVTTTSGATLGGQAADASSSADDTALTTQRLTAATGTFTTFLYDETGAIGTGATLPNGQYTEIEWGLTLKAAGAVAGDTFDFRIYHATSTAFTTYTQTPRVTATGQLITQTGFRVRQDVGAVGNPPKYYALENTAVTLPVETTFRIRFAVSNVSTAAAAGPQILRVSKNSGAYTAVTTTSGATLGAQSDSNASSSTDEAAVTTATFRLTAGTGTALQGVYDETGSATLSITNGFYTELEYGLILKTAGAANGDTFDFRVYNSTSPYGTYTQTPRVTCSSGNSLVVTHYRFRTDSTPILSNTPTWGAAEDTTYFPGLETTFRLRLAVDNLSATLWVTNIVLMVSKNGGAYSAVTTSSTNGLQSADASSTASNASLAFTSFSLTAGTGTADNGFYDELGSFTPDHDGNRYTEYEFGLILKTANLTNGDVLTIRPYTNSLPFSSYSVTPTITVSLVDTEDDLLANNVLSASSVTQPAVQQVHNPLANDVVSPSSVTQPVLGGIITPMIMHQYRMRRV